MSLLSADAVRIPCDVPPSHQDLYRKHYLAATAHTGRLMLFAGDQKIEHLNDDFHDPAHPDAIASDDASPEHLFRIASRLQHGVFATQLGLINLYGRDYPNIAYIAKLNAKSHLVSPHQRDPVSRLLWQVADVQRVREYAGLNILGVGYTCYLGSEFEAEMLSEAAQVIQQAHALGLLAVIWMYPRGKAVTHEKDAHLIAGACGAAACLGADFVKVNYPETGAEAFRESILAAGHTGVICAGGKNAAPEIFLQQLHDQIHIAGARGNATGRNVHQRDLDSAVRLCNAISAIVIDNRSVAVAQRIYSGALPQSAETDIP